MRVFITTTNRYGLRKYLELILLALVLGLVLTDNSRSHTSHRLVWLVSGLVGPSTYEGATTPSTSTSSLDAA
jgi:hypothetical protein